MDNQQYTPASYKSDQAVRWCPGCGDHAILNTLHKAMATLGIPPTKLPSSPASVAPRACRTT